MIIIGFIENVSGYFLRNLNWLFTVPETHLGEKNRDAAKPINPDFRE